MSYARLRELHGLSVGCSVSFVPCCSYCVHCYCLSSVTFTTHRVLVCLRILVNNTVVVLSMSLACRKTLPFVTSMCCLSDKTVAHYRLQRYNDENNDDPLTVRLFIGTNGSLYWLLLYIQTDLSVTISV